MNNLLFQKARNQFTDQVEQRDRSTITKKQDYYNLNPIKYAYRMIRYGVDYLSNNLIKTSLYLKKEDMVFLNENSISLTKFVRNSIKEIKTRQTHDLQSGSADENPEGISDIH